jgi:hypothetical protein
MLSRVSRLVATCLLPGLIQTAIVQPPASADPVIPPKPGPNYVLRCTGTDAICVWVLKSYRHRGGDPEGAGKQPAKQVKRVCQFGGAAQNCSNVELGNWSNSQQCYLQRESPQPPFSDVRWAGHTDGSIWACVREQGFDQGRHLVTRWVWLPGEPDTVVVDPVTLAYRAVAAMQLAPPVVGTAPGAGQVGLVNMPVWLWVEKSENTWGPIVRQASVPGLTVTATAKVKAVDWSMGDGKTVRCDGAGTPYSKSDGIKASPDCGHLYRKSSREQTDCKYKVGATTRWDITWQSTLGDTGQISMTQEAATQLQIGEAVPVLVDPAGGQISSQPNPREGC